MDKLEKPVERTQLAGSEMHLNQEKIEITAITAGQGNGWEFEAEVLRASLGLWEGVECFVDHAWPPRSVRDLAGSCSQPRWDEATQGIRLTITPCGPSAGVLQDLAEGLKAGQSHPRVGFSADLSFKASGQHVTRIEKVYSVDLVAYPARGGGFVVSDGDLSKNIHKEECMESNTMQQAALAEGSSLNEVSNPAAPATGASGSGFSREEMCACLLDATLAAAHLPGAVENSLRARFGGTVFQAPVLQEAIREARQLMSDLAGGMAIQGSGRVTSMVSSEDQINAAMLDLVGLARPKELEKVQPARLSGIRELYTLLTGDYEFAGGFHADRVQFSTTVNLPSLLKNAMNKLIINQWEELGRSGYRWWEPLVQVEHFNNLQDITGVLVGEITVLPSVAEGAAYTELAVKDSEEVASWGKYGGYIGLTLEMFERDETHKLRQYPRKLASAALRRISSLVGEVFTSSSGTGPEMADAYHVFEAAHHANLGTTALSSAAWEAAGKAIYNQTLAVASGGTAPKQALDAKFLIVPRDLRLTGMQILYPSFAHESNIFSENLQKGQMGDVITCPEFSDANDWAAAADPRLAPGIILAERFGVLPEIIIADQEANGALFSNDEIRMKVRHWVSVFVADYRPLYKANVA